MVVGITGTMITKTQVMPLFLEAYSSFAGKFTRFGRHRHEPAEGRPCDLSLREADGAKSPHLWLPSSIQVLRWQVRSGGRASVSSLWISVVETSRKNKSAPRALLVSRFERSDRI